MRKADPRYVKNVFHVSIGLIDLYFRRVGSLIVGTEDEDRDLSQLASSAFLSTFVAFEGFIWDLFLAYLNRDFSVYQRQLSQRIDSSVTDKFGNWAKSRYRFAPERHVAVDAIANIVDPDGRVVVFSSTERMIEAAKSWLAPKHYSGLVSLSPADHLLIDTARAIRNYIAHESGNAYSEMNHKLKDVDCGVPNDGLGRGKNFIQDIGSFLKAYSGAERRVTRYLNRLDEISQRM